MKSFLRGLAVVVLILNGPAAALGLLALFGGEPATRASILGAAVGVALFAGILWMLTEVCEKVGDISQVLDDDICEALEAGRLRADFHVASPESDSDGVRLGHAQSRSAS
jgi:hypothetical protein